MCSEIHAAAMYSIIGASSLQASNANWSWEATSESPEFTAYVWGFDKKCNTD